MTVSLKHSFTSAIPDDPNAQLAGKVLPSHWNSEHTLTLASGNLLGRVTAGNGNAEEILLDTDGTLAANSATRVATQNATKTYADGVVAAQGAVIGPASAVSANVATFNGTTGKIIQDGGKALPAGALVGTTDAQTLTNKTIDTAGPNTLKINGAALTATTGTGSAVLAISPILTTPNIGVASGASLSLAAAAAVPLSVSSDSSFFPSLTCNTNSGNAGLNINVKDAGGTTFPCYWLANFLGMQFLGPQNGLIQFGTNNGSGGLVETFHIDTARLTMALPLKHKSYTVATLPAGTAGDTAFASNCRVFNGAGVQEGAGAGTGGLVTHNGTAWKIAGTNVTAVA